MPGGLRSMSPYNFTESISTPTSRRLMPSSSVLRLQSIGLSCELDKCFGIGEIGGLKLALS